MKKNTDKYEFKTDFGKRLVIVTDKITGDEYVSKFNQSMKQRITKNGKRCKCSEMPSNVTELMKKGKEKMKSTDEIGEYLKVLSVNMPYFE